MKQLFISICLLTLLAIPFEVFSQTQPCVIPNKDLLVERLLKNKERAIGQVSSRAVTYVPIKFHLVAKSDGLGRVSEKRVLEQLCALNADFAPLDIVFYIKAGFSYINSTTLYNDPETSTGVQTMSNFKEFNAVNVYIAKDATPPGANDLDGTILGHYNPGFDWLVMKISEVNQFSGTLSHEMGHYFTLLHTHNGWDVEPYNEGLHGNPVQNTSPGGTAAEKEDRSGSCKNCESAGDYICDTPPDYNFGFGWNGCNPFTLNIQDPCNTVVDPMENNFMGYFIGCGSYIFSNQQGQLMRTDLANRPELATSYIPNTSAITQSVELISPINEEVTPYYNFVELQWEDVPGADRYVVEVSRSSDFNVQPIRKVVWGSYALIEGLDNDKSYYWRITPFNETNGCGESDFSKFISGSTVGTKSADMVNNWFITPNPASANSALTISMEANMGFDATIALYDINGKLVNQNVSNRFESGLTNYNLSTDQLLSGMYVLIIRSENLTLHKKIVISN